MRIPKWCRKKKWYVNLSEARRISAIIWANQGIRLWPYRCDFCEGWHLTSKSPDEQLHSGYSVKLK